MNPCPPLPAALSLPADPLFLWSSLAMKTMQMSTAAMQVIAIRTARMAAAGVNPTADDRLEMKMMGDEKLDAFARAGTEFAAGVTPVFADLAGSAFRSGMEVFTAATRLATSRSLPQTMRRHRRLADTLMSQTAAPGVCAAARLAHRALEPVHATATANARRLVKGGRPPSPSKKA